MSEFVRLRLARASRNWFSGSELACSADAYVRRLNERGYAFRTSKYTWRASRIIEDIAEGIITMRTSDSPIFT